MDSPAVAEVSHWEWKYAEHGGNGFIWVDNHTYKYMTEAGQGYDHWWDIPWHTRFYERTEHKHKVIDVKGQKEQSHMEKVVDSPAVPKQSPMEKVIDVVGSPAIGEPTMQKMTDPGKPEVKGSPATYCEWYTWDTGSYTPNATGASDVHWPQTLVGAGKIAPTTCGLTYQQDLYGGTRAADRRRDRRRSPYGDPPEDSAIVKDWHFASSDKCPEITRVEVQPTVTTTDVCGPDNATLVGDAQTGVVWSAVTTGEDGTMSITASPAAGYSFPDSFKTTFTMKDSGEACIIPVEVQPTVTTTDVCGPDNATLVGNAQVGVVWSAVTTGEDGTMSITASPAAGYSFPDSFKTTFTFKDSGDLCPIEVTAVAAVADPQVCGPNNDVINVPTTEGVTYTDTGWNGGTRTITAAAKTGYVLVGTKSWTFTDEAVACPIDKTDADVTATAPTVAPVCLPDNDTVTIPEVTGVIYHDTGWVDGERTITATAATGYKLIGDHSWTFTDVPSAGCEPVGPVFSGTEALASTGPSSNTNGLIVLAFSLLASGGLLVTRKMRKW